MKKNKKWNTKRYSALRDGKFILPQLAKSTSKGRPEHDK